MDEILTEAVLEATRDMDRWSSSEVLAAIHEQDCCAVEAVGKVLPEVARGVDVLTLVLQGGGRWINLGAGTSGRMGALDAAEIPPTFGYPPDRVRAVLAGGPQAMLRSVEGAEDDGEAARRELRSLTLMPGDAVIAISASGRTPFALAGLREAREVGARTLSISCDPGSPLAREAEVAIVLVVGPEVIAGSTRMKGGLTQKMVLHLLSTAVMVRLGRVEGNQMTNLRPVNNKLQRRAVRIIMSLTDTDEGAARTLLDEAHGNVEKAVSRIRREP